MRNFKYAYALFAGALLSVGVALAHIRIYPTESILGAREKYTMRVPNEKQAATIRIEGEFPKDLKIYDFEFKPGWKVDIKKEVSRLMAALPLVLGSVTHVLLAGSHKLRQSHRQWSRGER